MASRSTPARLADVVVVAGSALRSTAKIARDRLLGDRLGSPLPGRLEALDPKWLSAELSDAWPGVEVEGVRVIGGHSGTTDRARIGLRYRTRPEAAALPDAMFAKLAPRHLGTALFVSVLGLGTNEVRFYRELADEVPVDIPRVFLARAAPGGERFLLLMEDLAAAGCTFRGIERPCTAAEARAVVTGMASLHARYWESDRFDVDLSWLPARGADPAHRAGRLMCEFATAPALRRFGEAVSDSLRRAIPILDSRREQLEDLWARPPRTLIHGDPHLGNLYFRPGGEAGFLDWQIVRRGQGMRDVAHFLISSLAVADRRELEDDLIAHYLESLAGAGVQVDAGEARAQFQLHTFYEWFSAAVTAAAGTLQPTAVAHAAMQRANAAIEDWHAVDRLVDELGKA